MNAMTSSRAQIASFVLAGAFAVAAAHAQTAATSSFTIQISGNASAVKTGLPETVMFAGPLVVTSTVVTDPALGPTAAVFVDGRGVVGTGAKTKSTYSNTCVANLTRPFGPTDAIQMTCAFFPATAGGYMSSKTALVTINLTYDAITMALTNATASMAAF